MLYTRNQHGGLKDIRLKSSLVAIPVALCCSNYITDKIRQELLKVFYVILLVGVLYSLLTATWIFANSHDESRFFYHALVKPLHQHAIQFSILIFIALVSLLENLKRSAVYFTRALDVSLIILFSIFIFLLSSKLVISCYIVYLVYLLLFTFRFQGNKILSFFVLGTVCISLGTLVIFTHNPISRRFAEIFEGNLSIVNQEKFTPANYFNGLQFRLLQWRFAGEILTEKNSWLVGVSPGDAQSCLDQKYVSENMYIGTPERGDKGFLGYNTHNEFLEALLQSGVAGLLLFLLMCVALVQMAIKKENATLTFITILLVAYSFSESVLESQFSLVIFLFFPLFFYLDKNEKQGAINS